MTDALSRDMPRGPLIAAAGLVVVSLLYFVAVAVNGLAVQLAQTEFDALTSFAFNCGGGALSGGIARSLHAGDRAAAMAVLSEYVHAGGVVSAGLVRRRAAESALFLHGSYGV